MQVSGGRGFIFQSRFAVLSLDFGTDDRLMGENVDLTLDTREVGGRTIVAVGGEIDVYTAPKLRDRITELVAEGVYDLVIDMEAVEFLDSTGLGVLVGGLKKVRAHDGSLQLICNQDRLLKIFRITGLAKVFVIHESAEAALA
ncbi:anti-sigma B factor antagonist [Nocardioides psychrotolerans]|uniref:Anti-sigma factor antagonist n=2 Tax=Nocardioides psychrotolerans TaxID=1005945 RepID=A0A1I3DT39_9ACTN|nr:anti-sigma B factor antagonist [Nocardioides psychrotolerans]